jgi:hypothetical protein
MTMPDESSRRPSLLIDKQLVERKAWLATVLSINEVDVMDLVWDVVSGLDSGKVDAWINDLAPDRVKTRKAHVMRRGTHENLMKQKDQTGHSVSRLVEVGLLALTTAAATELGENCGAGSSEVDRIFSEIDRVSAHLKSIGDHLNAGALSALYIHFDNEIDEAPKYLVQTAQGLKDSESIFDKLAKLTPDQIQIVKRMLEASLAAEESGEEIET